MKLIEEAQAISNIAAELMALEDEASCRRVLEFVCEAFVALDENVVDENVPMLLAENIKTVTPKVLLPEKPKKKSRTRAVHDPADGPKRGPKAKIPDEGKASMRLSADSTIVLETLDWLRRHEGATAREYIGYAGVEYQTGYYRLRRMRELGLVRKEESQDGTKRWYVVSSP